jgi:hypothetical protein
MHHPNEKGTDVTHIEHSSKAPRIESGGIFVTLRAFLRLAGSGASSHRSATRTPGGVVRGVAGVVAVVAGTLVFVAPALASGPPFFIPEYLTQEVHSTRVGMEAILFNNELETEWQTAYATSPSGPWTVLLTGTEKVHPEANSEILLFLGPQELASGHSGFTGIRHLTPGTSYYARFFGKNQAGEVTEIVPFKTLPVGKPEIAQQTSSPGSFGGTTFKAGVAGPHSAVFSAQVETNGAQTVYSFEYAPFEVGPWTTCATGSVTVAEDFAVPSGQCTGLNPETTYYIRVKAGNVQGATEEIKSVTTRTAKPRIDSPPEIRNVTATSAHLTGRVVPSGSKTRWRFESAASGSGPWTPIPGAAGTISQAQAEALPSAEDGVVVEAAFPGLSPTNTYYVRLFAENECASGCGEGEPKSTAFETSGAPGASTFATHTLHGESLRIIGAVNPNSLPTSEEQTIAVEGAPTGGTFTLTFNGQSTGGASTGALTSGSPTVTGIPLPPVKGTGNVLHSTGKDNQTGNSEVTGVTASVGEFRPGQAISGPGIAPGAHINSVNGTTLGLSTENTKAVTGAALTSAGLSPFTPGESIGGAGIPAGTTITAVEYPSDFTAGLTLSANATAGAGGVALTANLPFDAAGDTVARALDNLSSVPVEANIKVTGNPGGPFTVYFGANRPLAEKDQPQIEANASGLTPSGSVTVATTQQGGVAYDSHYHFEYEMEEEGVQPFAHATATPPVDLGSGNTNEVVGVDLPGLQSGASYRFRIVAGNTSPGNPVVDGEGQALTVPVAPSSASAEPCPNEALRTGPSANLPDCRAYEQLTPEDKEGAQQAFHYGGGVEGTVFAGEDGERFMLEDEAVNWGSGPGAGHSPYLFSRTPAGWRMTAAAIEPEFGVKQLAAQVFAPDLTRFGFQSGFNTSAFADSKDVEFRVGPPGGPYTTVATVPRKQLAGEGKISGWVAASADFSKLILQVEDRNLVEPATGTKSGSDLYEYSGGGLRQVNVKSNGERIGTCGATIVRGKELAGGGTSTEVNGGASGAHSVSADGSRVFFEAVPGNSCSEPSHLYIRVNGAETLDVGVYKFLAANAEGNKLLLQAQGGETLGYNTETAMTKAPSPAELATARELAVLGIPFQVVDPEGALSRPRYTYWQAGQVYRYDSVEKVYECVSCASSFNPEPRLGAFLSVATGRAINNGALPSHTSVSANGDYAFFSTPAALLPSDVDGEIPPTPNPAFEKGSEFLNSESSPSSDVYEWRRDGVGGCAHLQGCLALITNGRGGFLNLLLGTAHEGRDVFVYTSSQLLPRDRDTAGDIYDVRIGGGTPPPAPGPVECEGDACSTPASPPNDATPSSSTFQGAGNLLGATLPVVKGKTKAKRCKANAKKKCKAKHKKKTQKKTTKKTTKSNHRRGR